MKKTFLKKLIPAAMLATTFATPAMASNWLMLQGTEDNGQAPRAKVWGFMQLEYHQTDDTKLKAGPGAGGPAAFNQMGPQLTTSSGFNVKRARIGVRGNNFPLDPNVNYFLLAEFGNNGLTTGGKASQGQLSDASVTLNHIPGARIRAGLFKTPGSEEGMQAAFVADYVNFSNVTDRLLLERSFANSSGDTGRNAPVYGFRDTGVQVFDAFRFNDWEASYAVMVGNGNGLAYTDNNKHRDVYLYGSVEKIFGNSKGGKREGWKVYAWNQDGKRTIDGGDTYNRTRSGLGTTFRLNKWRAGAEYIWADGMIYGGTTGARTPANGGTFTVLTDQKADGFYVDLGYKVLPKVELDVRYDQLNSATENNSTDARTFTTTTLGAQYFFNKKTSVKVNYEIRDIDAPNTPAASAVHDILDSIDNRFSVQLTALF